MSKTHSSTPSREACALAADCPYCGSALSGEARTIRTCSRCRGQFTHITEQSGSSDEISSFNVPLPDEFQNQYRLVESLRVGAGSEVFRAVQIRDGKPVAIKFLLARESKDAVWRFTQEASLLSRISSAAIVKHLASGEVCGHPYLVTEFMPGGNLRDRLSGEPMDWQKAVHIALDCLRGTQACHNVGIVHRDLKPENILFGEDGRARVADLGIAKNYGNLERITATYSLIGTPFYMAPEQLRGEPCGMASDVFSMGAILFEMLAGRLPWDSPEQICQTAPSLATQRPDLPAELIAAVDKALSLQLSDRPQSAGAFARRLERAVSGHSSAPSISETRVAGHRPPVRGLAITALALACLLLAVGFRAPIARPAKRAPSRPAPRLPVVGVVQRPALSARVIKYSRQVLVFYDSARETSVEIVEGNQLPRVAHANVLPGKQALKIDGLTPLTRYTVRILVGTTGATERSVAWECTFTTDQEWITPSSPSSGCLWFALYDRDKHGNVTDEDYPSLVGGFLFHVFCGEAFRGNWGLSGLLQGLCELTPKDRGRLAETFRYYGSEMPLPSASEKQQLVSSWTSPINSDLFHDRIRLARGWLGADNYVANGLPLTVQIEKLYYTNKVRGAQSLDALLRVLWRSEHEQTQAAPESIDLSLDPDL